ncbi:Uncharacterised protein [Candidatus Ornithobacterium hominis]|uniref:hypothetical protein n=1 Tax=Candidatus Ornithobacterium hominis TaxID=2497989 RepID=UPI000E5AB0EB|nr:hypothetical protein [Candidatus Ornithobacterium hominis]SZD72956.1 Uncharacterised protein [Candidatus Ornithobacterium hominis]
MKKLLLSFVVLPGALATAQVGINTDAPSATLNVKTKDDAQSPKNLELENQAGTKLVTVLNNGNVGIGITTPVTPLVVKGEIWGYSNNFANFTASGREGTSFPGTAYGGDIEHFLEQWSKGINDHSKLDYIKKDQYIVGYMGYDYKGTRDHLLPGEWSAPLGGTGMRICADGDHSLNSKPGRIELLTTPTDGIYTQTRMIINNAGNVGVGTAEPSHRVHIKADADPLKLEGLQAGTGETLVVDANGVIKKGVAASTEASKVASTTAMECNADNRGKMNFIQGADGKSDVFGICMKNANGSYYWGYMVGGNTPTNGTGAFGSGL